MSKLSSHSQNGYVIALTNQRGGVGKITTAVNLGISLVNQGKKVLLIDADVQQILQCRLVTQDQMLYLSRFPPSCRI